MVGPRPMRSEVACAASLLCAGVFLLFLLCSAPHRVHHFFDSSRQAGNASNATDHHGNKQDNPSNNASSCVFQAAANGCHLGSTALVLLFSPSSLVANLTGSVNSKLPKSFHPYASQIRAPPQRNGLHFHWAFSR